MTNSNPKNFKIQALIRSVSEQMTISLRENLIHHPGELGTAREEIIREFLRKHLPKRFGVSTGFVFDVHGEVSKQIDVIIFDQIYSPTFETAGGKQYYPCESVMCVGEVKSVLTSKKEILKAFDVLRSVKILDRSGGGSNLSIQHHEPINNQENHLDQIFSFLFITDKCVSAETMRDATLEYARQNDRYLWNNIVLYFENYIQTYSCEYGICPNPMDASEISCSTQGSHTLLLDFYRLLSLAIDVTSIAHFSNWHYLRADAGFQDSKFAHLDVPDYKRTAANTSELRKGHH